MASDNLNLVRVVERPEQYFPRKQLCTRLPDGGARSRRPPAPSASQPRQLPTDGSIPQYR